VFLSHWAYDGGDPGLRLFTLANDKLPPVPDGSRVFEIGSCDTDFVTRVQRAQPGLIVSGIDQRAYTGEVDAPILRGDVLEVEFPAQHFAAVCSLSAIEHIGLGRYGDPIDPIGDVKTLMKAQQWLEPGGWCYFDVPYTPEGYHVLKTNKCRCYDDTALQARFGAHDVLGYTDPDVRGWVEKPTRNFTGPRPYWYVALLVRKEHAYTES
jgi:hypothetical protein